MTTQSAQAKAAALAAAQAAVRNTAGGTPQQKADAQAQLERAQSMPE